MARPQPAVALGADPITVEEVLAIADGERVRIGAAARARMTVSRRLVESALDRGDAVYGLTRRLGAGAGDAVDDQGAFQRQVIRNHLGGVGPALPRPLVRAAMAVRLAGLVQGGAGVRPQVADALAALLEAGVDPVVPETGSVGAADLTQLAAVAAVLVGEGRAFRGEADEVVPGADALRDAGLQPLELQAGEALALINTNAFSIGLAAVLSGGLEDLAGAADTAVALSLQAAALHRPSGGMGPYSPLVNDERDAYGQSTSAQGIRSLLEGGFLDDDARQHAVQDEVSFRSAPQVHGALDDAADRLGAAVDAELAARSENPLVDAESGTITPNGNFQVLNLALELESARLVIAHVAAVSERRSAVLSGLLRPFRASATALLPGLTLYSAADHVANLRQLAAPVTLSQTTLSGVEDHASLAWPAARAASRSLDLLGEVLAIEALHAADLIAAAEGPVRLGPASEPIADALLTLLRTGLPADALVQAAVEVLNA